MSQSIRFLSVSNVLRLHQLSIRKHGGDPSVRDMGLLESALAQPQATFFGRFLHEDLPTMAAAYLFHIAQNHAFVDGNKRTAAQAAIAFLRANGHEILANEDEFEALVFRVARGEARKPDIAEFMRKNMRSMRDQS